MTRWYGRQNQSDGYDEVFHKSAPMRNEDIEGIKEGRWDTCRKLPTVKCRKASDCVDYYHFLEIIYWVGKSPSRKLTTRRVPGTATTNSKELITLLVWGSTAELDHARAIPDSRWICIFFLTSIFLSVMTLLTMLLIVFHLRTGKFFHSESERYNHQGKHGYPGKKKNVISHWACPKSS